MILSPAERKIYDTEGLVKPEARLPEETIATMCDLLAETLEATKGQPPESIVCPYLLGWNNLPEEISTQWLDIAGTPLFLDYVSAVLGPDIILWGGQLFCKPAHTGLEGEGFRKDDAESSWYLVQ